MEDHRSTLHDYCEQYVGRTLIVEPQYGHGWIHPPGGPFGEHNPPTPFHIRVERLYSYKGDRRGVLARVTETGFVYDGFWLVSMTRHGGVWDFIYRPALCNLLLCPDEPIEGQEQDSPEYGKIWPIWHLRGEPQVSGFGRIAESVERCAAFDAREEQHTQQSRRSTKTEEKDYSLDGKDRAEWNYAWASMPHRCLLAPPKIDFSEFISGYGDLVSVTISEDPPQFSAKSWRRSETCPVCGETTVAAERLPVSLHPTFANGFSLGVCAWIHRRCFESCPDAGKPAPIPW